MSESLFREEAIAHQESTPMGDAFAIHSSYFLPATISFLFLCLLLICFIVLGEYHRKQTVPGFLVPSQGMIKVFTPQSGTVIEKQVSEGQAVEKDDVLFVLSSEQSSAENSQAQSEIIEQLQRRHRSLLLERKQQQELNALQRTEMDNRLQALKHESQQLSQETRSLQQRHHNARITLDKFIDLNSKRFTSELQTREQRDRLLTLEGELHSLKRDKLQLQRAIASLNTDIASNPHRFSRNQMQLDRQIASVAQQITEQRSKRSVAIRAPVTGTTSAILIEPGQLATPDKPLLSILPVNSHMQAHLLVPSKAIGFITTGQPVSLRYEAFPFQRFGSQPGKITEMSRVMIAANETLLPIRLQEPAYRVVVEPAQQSLLAYRQTLPLQSGMLLEADILLDKQPLYRWVFDPLFSLAGKL
ncbi:MAG: HlyD family efflux transporter periplasmic adaptor subunit [Ketobacter sp.]|nr:MAG: HlyD family efflux transporter periplasmic adaptor subunit [Ketobacter sp.]